MIDLLLQSAFRATETALVLGRAGFEWLSGQKPPGPRLLREAFERLGTTYIKLGQFIASTPSLFPPEYVEEFQRCLDRTPPAPFADILKIIREDYGRDPMQSFRRIEEKPLASASIAQVHEAELPDGRVVVLKVLKPGVQQIILTDMHFLFVASRLIEWFVPEMERASLSAVIEDLQKSMMEECDFLHEARNLREFREFLDRSGITQATAPSVFDSLTTRRVLVMERLYGIPLTDLEGIRRISDSPEETLLQALNIWFLSLMACDFFHADVHAGNLLVLEDGRIGFIDFGIVGRIGRDVWEGMEALMLSMNAKDYTSMAGALIRVGAADRKVDQERFARDLQAIFEGMQALEEQAFRSTGVDETGIHRLAGAISEAGRRNGLRFPREFTLLIKQFLYFDRYIRLLAPGLSLFTDERIRRISAETDPR